MWVHGGLESALHQLFVTKGNYYLAGHKEIATIHGVGIDGGRNLLEVQDGI